MRRRRTPVKKHPIAQETSQQLFHPKAFRRDSPNGTLGTQPAREKGRWPPANDNTGWNQQDQDLDRVLKATFGGTAERKIDRMTTIVFNMAREHFGTEERNGTSGTPGKRPNSREREILQDSQEAVQQSKCLKKEGIKDLTSGLRGQLCRLRR